ncbi:Protein BONZAI 3 [Dionaea muscipula]
MGGCFSDVRGGMQAVGGEAPRAQGGDTGGGGGHNDAVDFYYEAHGVRPLSTQLELSLLAAKLRDLDIISKSDPMAVVYAKKQDGILEELGRTEVVMNSLDPAWIQKISVTYQFEIVQPLVFRVYDVDTRYYNTPVKGIKLGDQDFIGEATCALSEVITKQNRSLALNLQCPNRLGSQGTITIQAEETVASKTGVEILFHCTKLDNKDLLSKSDPFLRISRIVENGVSVPICKTEVVKNSLNPTWKPVCLTMQQFVSKENPLIIECFDFNNSGNHVLIGKLQKSLSDLEKLHIEKVGANFLKPHHGHEKILKGQLHVNAFHERPLYSFIDYISSGFELNFMVAVDFTASNGDPWSPDSLHFIDLSGRLLNDYQKAILAVGEVIQFYDSDRRFPAWGFGGRMMDKTVSHCFNLNGSRYSAEQVEGIEGIMAAYSSALHNVKLAGPTLFSQVINQAAEIAAQSNTGKYYILLIITDGVLTDFQGTIDVLVKASDLPLSVLIVGVGRADFTQMEALDADNGSRLVSSTGRVATRDIVQFVPMREVDGGRLSIVQSLLEELPGQFLSYMRSRDIKPHCTNVSQSFA